MTDRQKKLQDQFNNKVYNGAAYAALRQNVDDMMGPMTFRLCETPILLTQAQYNSIIDASRAVIEQAMKPEVLAAIEPYVPEEFRLTAKEKAAHPHFMIVDFAMARDKNGELVPKLIEMQSSSSMFMALMLISEAHKQAYGLDLQSLPGQKSAGDFVAKMREAIVGDHDPKNVIILDLEPPKRHAIVDYRSFEKHLGIKVFGPEELIKHGSKLYYKDEKGEEVQIDRIYNRVIPEDFAADNWKAKTAFTFTEKLDVEWLSHPHWDFLMSKASLPYLTHPSVPKTYFLDKLEKYPADLDNYVLKPLFAYGGAGVKIDITREDLDAIPADKKGEYVLMEKVNYDFFIKSPSSETSKAEIRVMYSWQDGGEPEPMVMLGRVTRGKTSNMSGANFRKEDTWIGVAPIMAVPDNQKSLQKAPKRKP